MAACGGYIGYIILPQCIQDAMYPTSTPEARKTQDTAFLDGFRGIVVFLICVRHFLLPWCQDMDIGFLDGTDHSHLLRLPGIRMLYSGPNVPVMLVVSGFVVALKPLRMMHAGDMGSLYIATASSAFRRAFRLFPPPIVSTANVALAAYLGLFDYPYEEMPGSAPPHPAKLPAKEQLLDWARFVFDELTYPWTWKTSSPLYGAHLWTIPLQYRCSLLLALILTILGRMRNDLVPFTLAAILIYSFVSGRWDVATYIGGTLIAEGHVRHRVSELASVMVNQRARPHLQRVLRGFLNAGILIFSVFAGSFPRKRAYDGPFGYRWCYKLCSDYRVWHASAAIGLVIFAFRSQRAQSLLEAWPVRYLGRISFSLYIVHEPLLHLYAFRCVESAWRLAGKFAASSYSLGLLFSFAMTMCLVLWVAEMFHRLVDVPCGLLTARVDKWFNVADK